jgi:hypothetical protein
MLKQEIKISRSFMTVHNPKLDVRAVVIGLFLFY